MSRFRTVLSTRGQAALHAALYPFFMGTIMVGSQRLHAAPAQKIWDLTIAVPGSEGHRVIGLSPESHFHVTLRNVSGTVQRFWKETNSWGYGALRFELTEPGGKTVVVRKKERNWRKNIPSFWVVDDGGTVVFDVWPSKGEWDGLPIRSSDEPVMLRAVVDITPDDETREHDVWSGHVSSSPGDYVFR